MEKRLRSFSIFWALFIGISALAGSIMMFTDPSGVMWKMDMLLPGLRTLPLPGFFFENLIYPGIALLLVNGATNFTSFILLMKKHSCAPISVVCCGFILMLWIIIQFFIYSMNITSTLFFIFGILQAVTGGVYWRRARKNSLMK